MKNLKFFSAFLIIASAVFFWGCGDDSTPTTPPSGGTPPTIDMKVGSIYVFTNDSLDTNGTTVRPTKLKTYQSYLSKGSFFGQTDAFQIRSETKDTGIPPPNTISIDTFYVRYDAGKFYQYGVLQLISPSIPPTWDLVGDFTVSQGTSWSIATNVPIIIGTITATANITGKIAADTTFKTYGFGEKNVNCYRSEIVADIIVFGFSVGKVYVDYYIGDNDPTSNPSGMVRVKLRPVNLTVYQAAGVDQKIQNFIIP